MSASPIPFSSSSVLSPPRPPSTRPISRPSSRNSITSASARPPSPAYQLDDPVAIRNQMSTLKHTIRHQQAQYHQLENILLRGPRPLPPDPFVEMSTTPPTLPSPSPSSNKQLRRSSYDHLQALAGPNSSLPLPREDGGIKEGVPMSFGVGPANLSSPSFKRASSPTRTLSRIPVSSVGNARALAEDGQSAPPPKSPLIKPTPLDIESSSSLSVASNSSLQPPSPNKRASLTPGGTTKVLADLQAGVINARNALENTKSQLRISQRAVAQLTRQTEDLKEGRERMRLENEALNNAVARKERLLQEMLERARKAEAEAASLKTQLKTETTTSKKTIREMETALAESTALSSKSEREYLTLRDSIKQMTETWKSDTKQLRAEMQAREDRWRKEAEELGKKYKRLVDEVNNATSDRNEVKRLKEENEASSKQVEAAWLAEIQALKAEVQRSTKESEQAKKTADNLAEQLTRLRRLMQSIGTPSTESQPSSPTVDQEMPPLPV